MFINPKSQILNPKQYQITKIQNSHPSGDPPRAEKPAEISSKQYDLEDRTYLFAKHCRDFISRLPKMTVNFEYGKQLARSAGSQAANYIEANESISRKDFLLRLKICRKEAKESRLWLRLAEAGNDTAGNKIKNELIQEAMELTCIFGAILEKSK